MPRQPYGPGSRNVPGSIAVDELARVRHEVAAVADHDRVAVEPLAQLAVDARGLDRRGVGLERRRLGRALRLLVVAQQRDPVVVRAAAARRLRPARRTSPRDRRPSTPRASACAATCARRVAQVHDLRVAEAAEPEPEVERRARDEHEIGLLQRDRPGPRERELVVGGQRAAAHAVHEHRDARRLRRTRASRPSACAQYTSPPATSTGRCASRDQLRDPRDRVGIGRRAAERVVADRRELDDAGSERVERDVDERRAAVRRASRHGTRRRPRPRSTPADVAVAAVFVTDATIGTWSSSCNEPEPQRACGARPASTTTGEPFIHAAVIALTPLVTPGPGGERRATEAPRHLRPAFGREHRGLLVPRVDSRRSPLCTAPS